MGFFDSKDAKDRAERNRQARANAPIRHGGGFLSWGGSGRAETKPGLFGLGTRVVNAIEQENAKSGWFGLFGAKAVSGRAAEAQHRARGRGGKR